MEPFAGRATTRASGSGKWRSGKGHRGGATTANEQGADAKRDDGQ